MFGRLQTGAKLFAPLLFAAVFALGGASTSARAQGTEAAPAKADAPANTPLYTERGSATCMKCHDSAPVTHILLTPHAAKGDPKSPFGQHECESCHGPSQAHASAHPGPGEPRTLPSVVFVGKNISPIADRNKVCLTCHQNSLRMDWQGSQHHNN